MMKVKQISVFLENRASRLAEVTRTLAENNYLKKFFIFSIIINYITSP